MPPVADALLCEAIRTPRGRGRAGGALATVKPVRLLADLMRELHRRTGLDPAAVEDVVIGCVSPVGEQGGPIGRTAGLLNGRDSAPPGLQIDRFCASGLEAIHLAAQKVRSGWEEVVLAGGVESMSRVPMFSNGGAWQFDPGISAALDYVPQGISADLIATLDGFSRADLDRYAARSHRLAAQAWEEGRFARSVVPVTDAFGSVLLARDEAIRPGTTPESLAALAPVFAEAGRGGFDAVALHRYGDRVAAIEHHHTAGNSSAIVDGAALALVASPRAAAAHGLMPRARIVSVATIACEPTIMLTGPALAARKALALADLPLGAIGLFEVNEAFASVVLHFMAETGVEPDRVNVNGGAIAMGHPLGATGAMLVGTLVDEMDRRGERYGLATLCIGAGMASAAILERIAA